MADAQQYLKKTSTRLKRAGHKVAEMVGHGIPRARIIEVAQTMPESVIVMTTRGHSGVARWVLGSVADGLIHTAPVPVLLIRTEDLA